MGKLLMTFTGRPSLVRHLTGAERRGNRSKYAHRWCRAPEPMRTAPWVTGVLLLLLPLVALQFTDEVNWDETDFIVFGIILVGACG